MLCHRCELIFGQVYCLMFSCHEALRVNNLHSIRHGLVSLSSEVIKCLQTTVWSTLRIMIFIKRFNINRLPSPSAMAYLFFNSQLRVGAHIISVWDLRNFHMVLGISESTHQPLLFEIYSLRCLDAIYPRRFPSFSHVKCRFRQGWWAGMLSLGPGVIHSSVHIQGLLLMLVLRRYHSSSQDLLIAQKSWELCKKRDCKKFAFFESIC